MQCDFQNVTDLLMQNMGSSVTVYYTNLLNTLFATYLSDAHIYGIDRFTAAKLHKGTIRITPDMSEYYLEADRKILCKDIKELLPYLFDKQNLYRSLYDLIRFDDTLSAEKRKSVLSTIQPQYTDDASLTDLIYEAVLIAVTRQYEKDHDTYVAARYYSEDIAVIGDSLFRNSEYILPCKYFCGRDDELKELHDVVSENPATIITGIAGIGKSELVRAYVKEHKKEYQYIGYYFYKGSLKTIIANIINDPIDTDDDERYHKNLELLSTLGNAALLVIDNINVTPDEDECFDEVLNAGCKVIFTSNYRYDEYCTYDLKEFRSVDDSLELIRSFYDYQSKERDDLIALLVAVGNHTFCVELFSRMMGKGLHTPKTMRRNLYGGSGFKSLVERFSASKDKHPQKKTYYDHIKDLFDLMGLPDRHQEILRMMIVAPFQGVRKDFMAKLMGLRNMVIIEDLIEVGLVQEYENGTITLQAILRSLIHDELRPDNQNCAALVNSISAVCVNESAEIDTAIMHDMICAAATKIKFPDTNEYILFLHDCYKFSERYGLSYYTGLLITHEIGLHHSGDLKQTALVKSDAASFELMKGNADRAITLQEEAVKCSRDCDDILLQANTVNTYGYYLNLDNRKEEALKAMQAGLALFDQLDDDTFYYDKYRAIINYSDLLFSLGQTDEAIRLVSSAKSELQEHELQDTEIYADCDYSLGLYHLCLTDSLAGDEIVSAFRTFIDLYGRDSDFVQTRLSEVRSYIEMNDIPVIDSEPLHRLLGE